MKKSLIFIEHEHFQNSVELLEVARQIYGPESYETFGVSFGQGQIEPADFFDHLIRVQDANIRSCDIPSMTNVLEELQKKYRFDSILLPATHIGRMLAPRLAMRLRTGLTADITAINHTDDGVEIVRPAFGGKLMAGIMSKTLPLMLTVRQNVFLYEAPEKKQASIVDYRPEQSPASSFELLETCKKDVSVDIRDSEILISGGGGIQRDFELVASLAQIMNAQVSASRKIVDSGIAPRSIQVGQSGKTVSPRLYIALGINGSIQHVEGLKNVENIISVNTSANAPILSISDISVTGDAKEFILKLIDKIKKEKLQKSLGGE